MVGRVAMKDIFNMTAGTSTGSLIAAGLSYPNETIGGPMNATDFIEIYKTRGKELFIDTKMSFLKWLFYGMLIFCYITC